MSILNAEKLDDDFLNCLLEVVAFWQNLFTPRSLHCFNIKATNTNIK